jgi:hypothetical protein
MRHLNYRFHGNGMRFAKKTVKNPVKNGEIFMRNCWAMFDLLAYLREITLFRGGVISWYELSSKFTTCVCVQFDCVLKIFD